MQNQKFRKFLSCLVDSSIIKQDGRSLQNLSLALKKSIILMTSRKDTKTKCDLKAIHFLTSCNDPPFVFIALKNRMIMNNSDLLNKYFNMLIDTIVNLFSYPNIDRGLFCFLVSVFPSFHENLTCRTFLP